MNFKPLSLFAFFLLLSPSLAACGGAGAAGETINLRVLNWEDYIGEYELEVDLDGDGEYELYPDVLSAFEAYERNVLGKNVKVIYDTFDTNETMLSSLKTGKSTYDLICPSDYTIQKMMSQGMLEPYDADATPNYDEYASHYLQEQMNYIKADDGEGNLTPISEYSRGYMWGTLGILYNPAKVSNDRGVSEDQVKFDMADWNSLWSPTYHGEMSIKDSMRDTYSVGIMKLFDSEIRQAIADSGYYDENLDLKEGVDVDEIINNITTDNLFLTMDEIFNRCDRETVNEVEDVLLSLKENVFGFEVDSGKDDIIKGLIGMNLAWSGDAVYSMDRGENEADETIYYSVPKTGGNIWFDGWVMPKSDSLHKQEAQEFVDFLSRPDISTANMDTIGYTSFIAGNDVLDLIRLWYDPRSYAMYAYADETALGGSWEDSDFAYDDDGNIVYQNGTGLDEDGYIDYGEHDMTGSTYEMAVVDGTPMTWEQYQDEILGYRWDVVDLTYMFEGTIEDEEGIYDFDSASPDNNPYLFYTDELEYIEIDEQTVTAGRQFYAQYPPSYLIPKLAAMKDYGDNNRFVLTMWENVKGNNLPVWGVIVFGAVIAGVAGFAIAALVTKLRYRKLKVERRKKNRAN